MKPNFILSKVGQKYELKRSLRDGEIRIILYVRRSKSTVEYTFSVTF